MLKRFRYAKLDDTRSPPVTALEHRSNRDDLKIRPLTDYPDLRRVLGLDRVNHPVDRTPNDLATELADRFDLRRLLEANAA